MQMILKKLQEKTTWWRNSWDGIVENPLHLMIGILMTVVGYRLMTSRDYFFWPPNLAWLFNDDAFGFFGLIVGVGLIIYTVRNKPNMDINTVLLSCAGGFVAVLAALTLGHDMFAGAHKMAITGFLAVGWVFIIFYTARHSNYKKYKK